MAWLETGLLRKKGAILRNIRIYTITTSNIYPPWSITFDFFRDAISGVIDVAVQPQLTKLWGSLDHYTK